MVHLQELKLVFGKTEEEDKELLNFQIPTAGRVDRHGSCNSYLECKSLSNSKLHFQVQNDLPFGFSIRSNGDNSPYCHKVSLINVGMLAALDGQLSIGDTFLAIKNDWDYSLD